MPMFSEKSVKRLEIYEKLTNLGACECITENWLTHTLLDVWEVKTECLKCTLLDQCSFGNKIVNLDSEIFE